MKDNQLVDTTSAELIAILEKNLADPNDQFKYSEILGNLMMHKDYRDTGSFGNLHMENSIDHYTAKHVGDMSEGLVALHDFLVKQGATVKNPYDFESCDRYGVAFANENDFKTMAFRTQNYTYMIVLVKGHWWTEDFQQQGNRKIRIRRQKKDWLRLSSR
jgi:hypothetical protein